MSQSGERSKVNNKLGRALNLKLGASALLVSSQSSSAVARGCAECQPMREIECVAESLILDVDLAQRLSVEVQILAFKV